MTFSLWNYFRREYQRIIFCFHCLIKIPLNPNKSNPWVWRNWWLLWQQAGFFRTIGKGFDAHARWCRKLWLMVTCFLHQGRKTTCVAKYCTGTVVPKFCLQEEFLLEEVTLPFQVISGLWGFQMGLIMFFNIFSDTYLTDNRKWLALFSWREWHNGKFLWNNRWNVSKSRAEYVIWQRHRFHIIPLFQAVI